MALQKARVRDLGEWITYIMACRRATETKLTEATSEYSADVRPDQKLLRLPAATKDDPQRNRLVFERRILAG